MECGKNIGGVSDGIACNKRAGHGDDDQGANCSWSYVRGPRREVAAPEVAKPAKPAKPATPDADSRCLATGCTNVGRVRSCRLTDGEEFAPRWCDGCLAIHVSSQERVLPKSAPAQPAERRLADGWRSADGMLNRWGASWKCMSRACLGDRIAAYANEKSRDGACEACAEAMGVFAPQLHASKLPPLTKENLDRLCGVPEPPKPRRCTMADQNCSGPLAVRFTGPGVSGVFCDEHYLVREEIVSQAMKALHTATTVPVVTPEPPPRTRYPVDGPGVDVDGLANAEEWQR